MIQIEKGQRWMADNLHKKCQDPTHYDSRVILEITHVYAPKSRFSQGARAKVKVVQVLKDNDSIYVKGEHWLLGEEEMSGAKCSCHYLLDGQNKP